MQSGEKKIILIDENNNTKKRKGGVAWVITKSMLTVCGSCGDYSIKCGHLDQLNGKNLTRNRNKV